MTRRRWIADEVHGNTAALLGDHASHLTRVLRAKVGQKFDIAASGSVRLGRIVSISDSRVEFELGEEQIQKRAPEIALALSIFKFDRMEWAIEKCVEIGVARIIPIVARRTDAHLAIAAAKRHERWQRIARQAAQQSRRTSPPVIDRPVKLADLSGTEAPPDVRSGVSGPTNPPSPRPVSFCRIVLAESENETRLRDALVSRPSQVMLAIGPEGGWSADELQWVRDRGWTSVSLGDTILRAETAAIVAAALALDALA